MKRHWFIGVTGAWLVAYSLLAISIIAVSRGLVSDVQSFETRMEMRIRSVQEDTCSISTRVNNIANALSEEIVYKDAEIIALKQADDDLDEKIRSFGRSILSSLTLVLNTRELEQTAKFEKILAESNVPLPNIVEKVINSVVHVENVTQGWQGSGVAITEDILVTARHVNEDGDKFVITLNDGTEVEGVRAISSKEYDLGFIQVAEPNLIPAQFGSIKDCRLGQQIFTIGSPYGKMNFNSVTLGILSGVDRNWEEEDREFENYGWSVAFTTDAAGHPGNSGCPVFTMDGEVRGILVGGLSPVLIYCIPIDLILDDVEEIKLMFKMDKYYLENSKLDSYEDLVNSIKEIVGNQ